MARLRTHLAALAFGMSLALGGTPASALERFVLTSASASDVAGLLQQAEPLTVVPTAQIHCTTTQLSFLARFD